MKQRLIRSVLWHTKRVVKVCYFFFRILLWPRKSIEGVTILLKQGWAFTVKDHILRSNYETGELDIIKRTLLPSDKVLEIGTGLGFLTIYCARITGEQNTISMEANPFLKQYHEKIFDLNEIHPRILYEAVGESEGSIEFYVDTRMFWASSAVPFRSANLKKIKVPTANINTMIEQEHPTYLIMDVEGLEYEIVNQLEVPGSIRKIQMEVHPQVLGEEKLTSLKKKLEKMGFRLTGSLSSSLQYFFEYDGQT